MYRFVVVAAVVLTVMALGVYAQSTRTANPAGRASYSAEQVQRGKALYSTNCSTCHLENLKGNCPGETVAPNSRAIGVLTKPMTPISAKPRAWQVAATSTIRQPRNGSARGAAVACGGWRRGAGSAMDQSYTSPAGRIGP